MTFTEKAQTLMQGCYELSSCGVELVGEGIKLCSSCRKAQATALDLLQDFRLTLGGDCTEWNTYHLTDITRAIEILKGETK